MPLQGFFSRTELESFALPVVDSNVPKCAACKLYLGCKSPKMEVHGNGKKRILVIGEAPSDSEDEKGRPFCDKANKGLQNHLSHVGVDLLNDCWVYNSLICHPPEKPTDKQIEYCRPNVFNTIKRLNPNVIILLGPTALSSVVGKLWKNPGPITRWAGFQAPSLELNAWICPTFHPSYVMREDSQVLNVIYRRQLNAACELKTKPWKTVPDFASRVQCYLDGESVAEPLRQLLYSGRSIAFDYETTMTKPDSARARIVCCSASDGKASLAFVWEGTARKIMRKWLKSDIPKIAANMKFEIRWSEHEFGFAPRGWKRDTMLSGHVLDNRKLISGLKFQAFVKLGQGQYDKHVAPYLKAKIKGGYEQNNILKCPKKDLLQYCGMDSLLEALLDRIHTKEFSRD